MRLTVLGNYGSFPGVGGACSGYLLEQAGWHILLECGNGVLSRLQRYCRIEDLDGIILSHLHSDHMADLLVLRYALETKRALGETLNPLPLYMPATPEDVAKSLDYEGVFAIRHIKDSIEVRLGPLGISFVRMEHSVESYAVVVSVGGKKMVYSGDTIYNSRLVEIAKEADLMLCESTAVLGKHTSSKDIPHLTARQAAEIAAQAGVCKLLLTHFWYEEKKENYLEEARKVFSNTSLAEELISYEL
ncbi:MAG: MBL fold metallo-hydrolase [Chloroflexota bacterium]